MTTVINLFTKQIITCDAELIPGKIIQPDERDSVMVGVTQTITKAPKPSKPATMVAGFRYAKTLGTYKASNVVFNETTREAYSYDWWRFVEVINKKVICNTYNYSPSTIKHRYKVRTLLNTLGIKIDQTIDCPRGLQDLDSGIQHYESEIKKLQNLIDNPKSKEFKNVERRSQIATFESQIKVVKQLIKAKRKAA